MVLSIPNGKDKKLPGRIMNLEAQIERLNKIGIALSSETDLEKLLELIVYEAREFSRADAGSLYIIENDRLYFRVAQNSTLDRRNGPNSGFKPYPLPLSEKSIAGYVALKGDIINIDDVYQLPDTVPYSFNPEFDVRNDYRTTSMLVVPMKDRDGEILGVLQLINAMDEEGRVVPFDKALEPLVMSLGSQAAVAIRNAKLISEIRGLFRALIQYSASAIDARSPHTAGHSRRVAAYATAIAKAINRENSGRFANIYFSDEEIEELNYSAWLHDIGKIGVPESVLDKKYRLSPETEKLIVARFELIKSLAVNRIYMGTIKGAKDISLANPKKDQEILRMKDEIQNDLEFILKVNRSGYISDEDLSRLRGIANKTYVDLDGEVRPYITEKELECLSVRRGNLTNEEYKKVQGHVLQTLKIVGNIPFTKNLKNIPFFAASHHEMLDGSGYPRGLKGEELPVQSRILAVVDIYDALTAIDRPYRRSLPPEKAYEILKSEAAKGRLDQDIVELFFEKELYKEEDDSFSKDSRKTHN